MLRKTKIVATLGPASSDPAVIERMIRAGVDVFRLNFSHGKPEEHLERGRIVREASDRVGRPVGILADLQGPKIRIGRFENDKIELERHQRFILDPSCELGDATRVGLDYKQLPSEVGPGTILLLDDGRIVLDVVEVIGTEIHTRVTLGGELSNNKGINRRGGGLSAPALTAKDMDDVRTAARMGADFMAVSFPRSAADMKKARQLMTEAGGHALMIAKIERAEATQEPVMIQILQASDGIMVARGDLAVEVGDAAVPALQKWMIGLARKHNKLTITATQMMESMISSPLPTRAEVSDVANAVLDGTDAVMLSAETAAGRYPVEVVEAMSRICMEAEKYDPTTLDQDFLSLSFERIDQSIAMAALVTAHQLEARAIAALTQSGSTALWVSRFHTHVPIYALTSETTTVRRAALFRGVRPIPMVSITDDRDRLLGEVERILLQYDVVQAGDLVVMTVGEPLGQSGGTNSLKVVKVKPEIA